MVWVNVEEQLPQRSGYYDTIGEEGRCSCRALVWYDATSKVWKDNKYPIKKWKIDSYVGAR